ncbi:hypothetical protein BLNAU_21671 [Blattamonas nauphoetae]|uniref:Uncharacterized protein n=1 Tax=Blattamonas nauphoetae TaxID=2049346 RepID=A0ABQ9WV87_9EUKA|nr:hypothetical protein BLNAU_21671 [Blattamonas nauphoetae]
MLNGSPGLLRGSTIKCYLVNSNVLCAIPAMTARSQVHSSAARVGANPGVDCDVSLYSSDRAIKGHPADFDELSATSQHLPSQLTKTGDPGIDDLPLQPLAVKERPEILSLAEALTAVIGTL